MECKSSAIAKAIESASTRIPARSLVIFPLIQVAAGLLSGRQRDFDFFAILLNDHGYGRFFSAPALEERKTFQFPDLAIISENDGAWLIAILQDSLNVFL